MKTTLIAVAVLAVLAAAFFGFNSYIYNEKQGDGGAVSNFKSAVYYIDNNQVFLNEGDVEYFGNEARGDLDGDGDEDIAFLLTQEPEGSGTFYYLAAAINTDGKYLGTSARFIGDRIAPQTTEYQAFSGIPGGYVIVNYADRAPTDPMTAEPSVGKSLYAKYNPDSNDFTELLRDF